MPDSERPPPTTPALGVRGPRLGVDPGEVRVGLAVSDPDGILATPLVTLRRDSKGGADLAEIVEIVRDRGVVEVIVGLPRHLSGRHGSSARAATEYASELAGRIVPVPVHLSDERLTTVTATRQLAQGGVRGRRQRQVVDQAAAVVLLQSWLDATRSTRAGS